MRNYEKLLTWSRTKFMGLNLCLKISSQFSIRTCSKITVNVIHEIMSTIQIGNNFELFCSKLFCMKYVTYSTEVFKTFKSDVNALVYSLSKRGECDGLKERILDSKFFLVCSLFFFFSLRNTI